MRRWWLTIRSRAELADLAVTACRDRDRVVSELTTTRYLLGCCNRDLEVTLEMSDNEIEIRRCLDGLHRLDLAPEVGR